MHKNVFALLIIILCPTLVQATPEIKGSPAELRSYLENLPKEVILKGEAKIVHQSESGVVTIGIRIEHNQLQKALRSSQETRKAISNKLVKAGISQNRIKGTKFSSTPEYGLFGKKPNNYIVDNLLKITVENEPELQVVAGIIDNYKEVYYQGLELKQQKKEEIKRQLLGMALANTQIRKEIYENQLKLTLKPVSFEENISVEKPEVRQYNTKSKRAYSSMGSAGHYNDDLSLGEHVYYGSVHVKYHVK